MSVGFPVTKADLDTKMALEIGAVATALEACRARLIWLNDAARNTPYLTTTLGYTSGEETTLRAAFADLDSLRQISHGVGAKGIATIGSTAAANNFFFSAQQLGGVNWWGTI